MRFIYCVLFLMISCNLEKSKTQVNGSERKLIINIPDSIQLKDTLRGYIEYKNHLKSLDVKRIDTKFTFLYLTKSQTTLNSVEELKKVPHDTFVTIENNIIPIYDIKFQKRGNYNLQGYIVDEYFLEYSSDSTKIIYGTTRIDHTIKVY